MRLSARNLAPLIRPFRPCIAAALCCLPAAAWAQEAPGQPRQTVRVATSEAPPFVIQNDDGAWEGISIWLWERLAEEMDLDYEYQAMGLQEMLDALAQGEVDVIAGALSMTAEREEYLDFAHPFYNSGLGIAVNPSNQNVVMNVVRGMLRWEFLTAVATLLLVLLIAGSLLYLFERRHNRDQFSGNVVRGLGDGLWWAAVTMTTVGYGDKAPVTFAGRIVALVWMFISVITISAFTAGIASSLTVGGLQSTIQDASDLENHRVATVAGSTAQEWLDEQHVDARLVGRVTEALDMLAAGNVDAVVYDAPVLRYYATEQYSDEVTVLDEVVDRQDYAFALQERSPLREALNTALLEVTVSDDWQDVLYRYTGREQSP